MVAEITNEADFQEDCSKTWRKVFGREPESQLQAADLEKIAEFEKRIRAQYADIFREPTGLPPARKDGGFRIRTVLGAEHPHRSPYRMTPEEWEANKERHKHYSRKDSSGSQTRHTQHL